MKNVFIFFLAISAIALMSCNNYGKKVKISDSTEIYLKNDKATEADARLLGNYFDNTFKTDKQRSFQLSKEDDGYTVRMVVDEDQLKKDPSLDQSFMAIRYLIADKVFTGSNVKLILTDNKFKDFKTVKDTVFTE